jgi:hypothetical protein
MKKSFVTHLVIVFVIISIGCGPKLDIFKHEKLSVLFNSDTTLQEWLNTKHSGVLGYEIDGLTYYENSKDTAKSVAANYVYYEVIVPINGYTESEFADLLYRLQCKFDSEHGLNAYISEEYHDLWFDELTSYLRKTDLPLVVNKPSDLDGWFDKIYRPPSDIDRDFIPDHEDTDDDNDLIEDKFDDDDDNDGVMDWDEYPWEDGYHRHGISSSPTGKGRGTEIGVPDKSIKKDK